MLWTVISQADVFYQAAQGSRAPRSSNPFDYLNKRVQSGGRFFVRRAGSCGF